MQQFNTGATRDSSDHKLDYEAFLSPMVLEGYAEYMHKHRMQPDGQLRDGDNWQKGIPIQSYQKSLFRHLIQAWGVWRGNNILDDKGDIVDLKEALHAVLFNTMGYLHELNKSESNE